MHLTVFYIDCNLKLRPLKIYGNPDGRGGISPWKSRWEGGLAVLEIRGRGEGSKTHAIRWKGGCGFFSGITHWGKTIFLV